MKSDLGTVLDYKNETLVSYFCHHHPEFTVQEGQTIFNDLKAWMWLKARRETYNKKTYLFGPLLILDKMWHAFILHTKDYIDFSNQYFGSYFHHEIEPIGFEHIMEENELSDFLHDCFDHFGVEWINRRFDLGA
ncbi:hypothetical protein [Legionella drozanskii]|uniref:Uncharacterized protein n=2 Tax=Legionella TaxID=445 RepID=A0A0W0SXH7_9GAMM|nr:hypothetical protein Ldro_1690 [Legionella drozanskii LLAP-1]